jgi:ribonuclease G
VSRKILINSGIFETRVAIIQDGCLTDFYAERGSGIVGNVYKGRVENVLPGMDAAFVDIGLPKNAFLYVSNVFTEDTSRRNVRYRPRSITDVVKPGQELLVQVERAAVGSKGPRVSTRLSLPGRFVVLLGPDANHVGVSRRIEDPQERSRLRSIGERLRPPERGLIMRTESEGASEQELAQDVEYLNKLWHDIHQTARHTPAPALIHQDASIIYRICRDFFTEEVDCLLIDSPEQYARILETMESLAPELRNRVQLYQGERPLFLQYGLEQEIDNAIQRNVFLPSGGHLTIDETEALTIVDVNTGKFVGTTHLADTILTTNLEAADEIARQLRLRDIGGIIIIDFIDMDRMRDRVRVYSRLEQALSQDRARTKIVHISPLSLVEVTRKRTGDSLAHEVSEQCQHCRGRGRVPTVETIAIRTENQLAELAFRTKQPTYLIQAHRDVADRLIGPEGETAAQLEEKIGYQLFIRVGEDIPLETVDICPGTLSEIEQKILLPKPGEEFKITPRDIYASRSNQTVAIIEGYVVGLPEGIHIAGPGATIRLTQVTRSYGQAELVGPLKRKR